MKNIEKKTKSKEKAISKISLNKGVEGARRVLDIIYEEAFDPDHPNSRESQIILFNKFMSDHDKNNIKLPNFPRLVTFENIQEAEILLVEYVANGILPIERANSFLNILKGRKDTMEKIEIAHRLRVIEEHAKGQVILQRSLDELLDDLTSRKLSEDERIKVVKRIKETYIEKKAPPK